MSCGFEDRSLASAAVAAPSCSSSSPQRREQSERRITWSLRGIWEWSCMMLQWRYSEREKLLELHFLGTPLEAREGGKAARIKLIFSKHGCSRTPSWITNHSLQLKLPFIPWCAKMRLILSEHKLKVSGNYVLCWSLIVQVLHICCQVGFLCW